MSGERKGGGEKPFTRRRYFDRPELVGASWWQEDMLTAADPVTRRAALRNILLVVGGGSAAVAAVVYFATRDDEVDVSSDALDLQKRTSWDVGRPGDQLSFPGASSADVDGSDGWRAALGALASDLAPAQPALLPYYVPTLFQASGETLRSQLKPIHDAAMDDAFERGRALATLFADAQAPDDVALLVDLAGPQSVAAAAAMADRFEPVFVFDNWPHPAGVVASHMTLAAVLYYLPRFRRARAARPTPARPMFVLDRQRLARYVDERGQFDNRYLAKLPSAQALRGLGASRLLYVAPSGAEPHELDDLNADFVAFRDGGLDVKMMALDDLKSASATPPQSQGGARAHHYWGGYPHTHILFWPTYGWYRPLPGGMARGRVPVAPVAAPAGVSRGASYRPEPRPTMFSSRTVGGAAGIGKQKPSGFGRVSVRASRSSGQITRAPFGRSGSLGRSRSFFGS